MTFDRLHAPSSSTTSRPRSLVEARFIPANTSPTTPIRCWCYSMRGAVTRSSWCERCRP